MIRITAHSHQKAPPASPAGSPMRFSGVPLPAERIHGAAA
jgi:hypothetical protein